MALTKKDFIPLAEGFNEQLETHDPGAQRDGVLDALSVTAKALKSTNPTFNRPLFLEQAGFPTDSRAFAIP